MSEKCDSQCALHAANYLQTYLGGFSTETEAARAYDRAALVYWGLTGFTNFPKEDYAAELPLLSVLQREEVVSNLRNNSHSMHK